MKHTRGSQAKRRAVVDRQRWKKSAPVVLAVNEKGAIGSLRLILMGYEISARSKPIDGASWLRRRLPPSQGSEHPDSQIHPEAH